MTPQPEPKQAATSGQGPVSIVSRAIQLDQNNQGAAAVYDPKTKTLYVGGPGEGHADVLPESDVSTNADIRGLSIVRDEQRVITILSFSATFDKGVSPEDMPAIIAVLKAHFGVSSLNVDMADPHAGLRGNQPAGGISVDLDLRDE